jgi:hypothetical protein
LNKDKIFVKKIDDTYALKFQVTIEEANGKTTHVITISENLLDFLPKNLGDEEIVSSIFRFLLDREQKEAILSNFDISIIPSYFPEFFTEIFSYL